jgi:DNA-directed RNA polymerase specialized sigma subunit
MQRFRSGQLSAKEISQELGITPRHIYQLYRRFLKSLGRQKPSWFPKRGSPAF